MELDRREFLGACAALSHIGSSVTNLLSVRGDRGDVLVMMIDAEITAERANEIFNRFAVAGVRCIIIADGDFISDAHVLNRRDPSFHDFRRIFGPPIVPFGDGAEIEHCLWCDTRLNIACAYALDASGKMTIDARGQIVCEVRSFQSIELRRRDELPVDAAVAKWIAGGMQSKLRNKE